MIPRLVPCVHGNPRIEGMVGLNQASTVEMNNCGAATQWDAKFLGSLGGNGRKQKQAAKRVLTLKLFINLLKLLNFFLFSLSLNDKKTTICSNSLQVDSSCCVKRAKVTPITTSVCVSYMLTWRFEDVLCQRNLNQVCSGNHFVCLENVSSVQAIKSSYPRTTTMSNPRIDQKQVEAPFKMTAGFFPANDIELLLV